MVRVAIESGELSPRCLRSPLCLRSYLKLQAEQARNSKSLRELRHDSRKQGQFYKLSSPCDTAVAANSHQFESHGVQ